ncbi:hypothetical protein ACEPAG_3549 [Sanghuangporus baumii]
MGTEAKSVYPDTEAVNAAKTAKEKEDAFVNDMNQHFTAMREQIGLGIKSTQEKFAIIHKELCKRRERSNKNEIAFNIATRTQANETNPEVLQRALTIVYDAVAAYVDSLQSADQQIPGGATWRLEDAKTSDGRINAEIFTQKLWEFLKLQRDSIVRTELAFLVECFCQKLVEWTKFTEDQCKSTKERDIDKAEDRFRHLKRASECFPKDDVSIKVLSFVVFAPKASDAENTYKAEMKDRYDSHRYQSVAYSSEARCDYEQGSEPLEEKKRIWYHGHLSALALLLERVRQAESDDPNRGFPVFTQADTYGDSDGDLDGDSSGTDDMDTGDKSESSVSNGCLPVLVEFFEIALFSFHYGGSFDMHTSFSIGVSGNIIDFGSFPEICSHFLSVPLFIVRMNISNVLPGIEKHSGCKPTRDVNTRL